MVTQGFAGDQGLLQTNIPSQYLLKSHRLTWLTFKCLLLSPYLLLIDMYYKMNQIKCNYILKENWDQKLSINIKQLSCKENISEKAIQKC